MAAVAEAARLVINDFARNAGVNDRN